jgi:glucokinase
MKAHSFSGAKQMSASAIGIDLGGTNLKGIVMDKSGQGRHLTRIPTEAERGGAIVMENILTLIEKLVEKEGSKENILGVGIGTPGFVSDGGVISGAGNLPGWAGTEVYSPIRQRFGLRATAANDVTVMAFAEARYGAGRGVRNMVCYALGTGIGGGIVIDHKLYKGSHGMAGELGHMTVVPDGLPCTCGMRGCVECYASATGIVRMAKDLASRNKTANQTPFVKEVLSNPDAVTSKMVYDYVKKNDPVACEVNDRACDLLARAIGMMENALSPDRIVLGGGVMMAGQIIIDTVNKHLPKYCFSMIREKCTIVPAELGEDAGVVGAAAMVFEEFGGK